MRRLITTITIILLSIPAFCQTSDRKLVENALCREDVSKVDTSAHRLWHLVRHQITGSCKFAPECVDFLPQAVKELGAVRGTFSYLDRVTRCSRIGTASYPDQMKGKDGRIHEGVDAYRRRRRGEKN